MLAVAVLVELESKTPELRRVRTRYVGLLPAASAANARCPGNRGNTTSGTRLGTAAIDGPDR
jgi:hypothetical protein